MIKTEIFEEIDNYSDDYAEFACGWIEQDIDGVNIDLSLPRHEVLRNLFNYLSEHYDDFMQEMAPEIFQKIENEKNNRWLNWDIENENEDDNNDENNETTFNYWLRDTNEFLISNKDEIICIAVTRLYKFLMQSMTLVEGSGTDTISANSN